MSVDQMAPASAAIVSLIDKIDVAHAELCAALRRQYDGGHALRISIPARPDHDTDLVIGAALREAGAMLRAVLALRPQSPAAGRSSIAGDRTIDPSAGESDHQLFVSGETPAAEQEKKADAFEAETLDGLKAKLDSAIPGLGDVAEQLRERMKAGAEQACHGGHVWSSADCKYRNGEWDWRCDCRQLSRDFPPEEIDTAALRQQVETLTADLRSLGCKHYDEADGVTPGWRNERAEQAEAALRTYGQQAQALVESDAFRELMYAWRFTKHGSPVAQQAFTAVKRAILAALTPAAERRQ